ncbi:deoxynucleoside monophosphate kinase [Vibrio phage K354]
MRKCIIMNANTVRAGKDTSANHMVQLINSQDGNLVAHKRNFKDKLIEATATMLNIPVEEFLAYYDEKTENVSSLFKRTVKTCNFSKYEWWKDVPMYYVGNTLFSKRQALIHCSEALFKPLLGKEVFGQMFVESLPEEGITFSGDGGFPDEAIPVIRELGKENVLIVRITRDIQSDVVDSRSLLKPEDFPPESRPCFLDVENSGSVGELKRKVEEGVGAWMNENL